MPHPTARLDLFVLPADPDRAVDADAVHRLGVARGWWDAGGLPGPAADEVVAGGFARARLEASERPRFYANQQGGFAVTCPSCGAPMVRPFQAALAAFRGGGARAVACPACGWSGALEALVFRPDAAFARGALHLGSVADATVGEPARAGIAALWGPVRTVGRRTS